jgi:putative peptide maturation dehydrogenase
VDVRRCTGLFVELDEQPRFDLAGLLAGSDGLDRRPRWLAHAPALAQPVEVTLAQLALLQRLPAETTVARAALAADADVVDGLLASGLLLAAAGTGAADLRDRAAREMHWWPPALLAQTAGAWSDIDVAARREVGAMPSAERMVAEHGPAPTHAYRRQPDTPELPLPAPRRSGFDDLLEARRTCRNFAPDAVLGRTQFATMLRRVWGAVGTRELAPGAVAVKKTSPAGGGLHAVEAYLLVQRVEGVAPGFYHYLALAHALEPLQMLAPAQAAQWVHRFVAGQDWFHAAPVLVIMVARFDRLFWKYRRHTKAWRVVHLDVGHLSQTAYLSATELGLGCFVTAAINDRAVEQALALPPLREGAIAIVGFGVRSATRHAPELDEFEPVRPDYEQGP